MLKSSKIRSLIEKTEQLLDMNIDAREFTLLEKPYRERLLQLALARSFEPRKAQSELDRLAIQYPDIYMSKQVFLETLAKLLEMPCKLRTRTLQDVHANLSLENKQLISSNQKLIKENARLTAENVRLDALLQDLLAPNRWSTEQLVSRQLVLQNCQIVQLKRQLELKEVAVNMDWFQQTKTDLANIKDKLTKIATAKVLYLKKEIKDLTEPISMLQTICKYFNRGIKNPIREKELEQSLFYHFNSEFLKTPLHSHACTFGEISSGRTEHLNLRHIARLEVDLQQLSKGSYYFM